MEFGIWLHPGRIGLQPLGDRRIVNADEPADDTLQGFAILRLSSQAPCPVAPNPGTEIR